MLSIFLLPLMRLYFERKEREIVYQRYIAAAVTSPRRKKMKKTTSAHTEPVWKYWSADLEEEIELPEIPFQQSSLHNELQTSQASETEDPQLI
jgi:hypothetical protein